MSRPSVFIGSSTEGLHVVEGIKQLLDDTIEVTPWSQGVFDLSKSYLDSLLKIVRDVDFAVIVLTPDDTTRSRDGEHATPRDNVLFELGLFMGHLGRDRCFFVHDSEHNLKLPSDLSGIAAATYASRAGGDCSAQLEAAATAIKAAISRVGPVPRLFGGALPQSNTGVPLPDVSGEWDGYGPDTTESNSTFAIEQYGSFIKARVDRIVENGVRSFDYEGVFSSGQLVLFFEDRRGKGFIIGTMVLVLSGDLCTLVGRSTYYHHDLKRIVSSEREYRRKDNHA